MYFLSSRPPPHSSSCMCETSFPRDDKRIEIFFFSYRSSIFQAQAITLSPMVAGQQEILIVAFISLAVAGSAPG